MSSFLMCGFSLIGSACMKRYYIRYNFFIEGQLC